jgi:hypothetical protein
MLYPNQSLYLFSAFIRVEFVSFSDFRFPALQACKALGRAGIAAIDESSDAALHPSPAMREKGRG